MSYRSFKRVLGETSLERKCRFLFGGCLLLLICGSFWWYGKQTEQLVYKQNRNKGRLLVDTILTLHHWKSLETQQDFKAVVEDLSEKVQNQEYDWSFILRSHIEGPEPTTDLFERQVWNRYYQRPAEELTSDEGGVPFSERFRPDRDAYEYYQPVYAQKLCVDCHRSFQGGIGVRLGPSDLALSGGGLEASAPLTEGDLMAVVKVAIPNGPTTRDLNWNRAILWATGIVTMFLAMVASYVIVRYVIVKPLKHLREVSDAISHGNIEKRAEIRTGDEFEALGVAFNRMLRHLVEAHEELRHVNADLDSKVDQLAQMNMRLYEMNRLKGDFLATMSHELRTPLNSIIGFSDVLGSIASLDEKQKRYVQNIQKSGKMLLDMINDILDLAKMESGKMELRPSHFRIGHVIGALCDMCRPLTEKKNIDLKTEIQPGLPELYQDQGKVQQILNNLLSNAIKFTPDGGRIVVQARRDDQGLLELVVTDTGVGIAEEDQLHIFEKFRQGQIVLPQGDAMTREYSGTGLGLSIVKELCRLLEGEIAVSSQLGRGSTFTVRLPWNLPDRPKLESPVLSAADELTRARRADFLPLDAALSAGQVVE